MLHVCEVDGFAILVEGARGSIALVVAETVLDADDDPGRGGLVLLCWCDGDCYVSIVVATQCGRISLSRHTKDW